MCVDWQGGVVKVASTVGGMFTTHTYIDTDKGSAIKQSV
jgi:hypothetical protein